MNFEIVLLEIAPKNCPYLDWELGLDKSLQAMVRMRINRLRLGNFGDCKAIQGVAGLYELRIHAGAGYRIYFGRRSTTVVVLLCAGSKRSQQRDIAQAAQYWKSYKKLYKSGKSHD